MLLVQQFQEFVQCFGGVHVDALSGLLELVDSLDLLRAGIVAAEKLRLLKEQGLFSDAIEAVRPKFDYKSALDGKTDHRALRREIENLVNR